MSFFKEWLESTKIEKPIDQFYKFNNETEEWELIKLEPNVILEKPTKKQLNN